MNDFKDSDLWKTPMADIQLSLEDIYQLFKQRYQVEQLQELEQQWKGKA